MLCLRRATFGYGGRPVLREVSLQVQPGELVAVVGPNGVGKSSLIKACSGLLSAGPGEVLIGGRDLRRMRIRERAQKVAVVPQAAPLPEAWMVRDVVVAGRTPYQGWLGSESPEDRSIALQALVRTGTVHLADRLVGELSGGEQQRVLLARALTQAAPVLLLDEPTAHLDLRYQDEILRLVRSLVEHEKLAVLLALHDLNLVGRFSDRVILLSNGSVFVQGVPSEVLTPDLLAPVYGLRIHVMEHPLHGTPLVLS